jgi:hypothetical protein
MTRDDVKDLLGYLSSAFIRPMPRGPGPLRDYQHALLALCGYLQARPVVELNFERYDALAADVHRALDAINQDPAALRELLDAAHEQLHATTERARVLFS